TKGIPSFPECLRQARRSRAVGPRPAEDPFRSCMALPCPGTSRSEGISGIVSSLDPCSLILGTQRDFRAAGDECFSLGLPGLAGPELHVIAVADQRDFFFILDHGAIERSGRDQDAALLVPFKAAGQCEG